MLVLCRLFCLLAVLLPASSLLAQSDPESEQPTATLTGRLLGGPEAPLPDEARVEVRTCRSDRSLAPEVLAEVPVAVEPAGPDSPEVPFSVVVPAGCVDATLWVGELAPVTFLDLQLDPGERLDLGKIELAPGGAILVRVVEASTGRPVPDAGVWAASVDDRSQMVAAVFGSRRVAFDEQPQVTDAGGWTRIVGIEPGEVVLAVRGPGMAPFVSEPVPVAEREEVVLDGLGVERAAALEVVVEDPNGVYDDRELLAAFRGKVEADAPASRTWLGELGERVPLGEARRVTFGSLPAGDWSVTLFENSGGALQPVESRDVELVGEEIRTVLFTVDGARFSGRVTFEGKAVPGASLDLEREGSDRPDRVRTRSDDEGRFEVILKQPGVFTVGVRAPEPRLATKVPHVALDDPREEVTVRVPAGRVDGRVVDAAGDGIAEAVVVARQTQEVTVEGAARPFRHLDVRARAGDDGTFTLEGLAPGRWSLSAEANGARSAAETVDLADDEVRSDVVLPVGDDVAVHGTVVTPDGRPVADATLAIYVASRQVGTQGFGTSADTDAAGRFTAWLPRVADGLANIKISAPTVPVSAVRTALEDGVELVVPATGGSLVLVQDEPWSFVAASQLTLVSETGGGYLTVSGLQAWSEDDGAGRKTIRGLAPGRWRLVHVASLEVLQAVVAGQGLVVPAVASFEIEAGEVMEVELPWRE